MSWMQWEDKEFQDFLKAYYGRLWTISWNIIYAHAEAENWMQMLCATFDKLASPVIYLREDFEKWKQLKEAVK